MHYIVYCSAFINTKLLSQSPQSLNKRLTVWFVLCIIFIAKIKKKKSKIFDLFLV